MQKYTRLAKKDDLSEIMKIIADAKAFLKSSGSPQWQNGYPNEQVILNDIQQQNGYVFIVGNKVAGFAAAIAGIEPTYQKIDGSWINNEDPYCTIHRFCFSSNFQGQGFAKIFIANIISLQYAAGIRNFRIDTHRLNVPMQTLVEHNGFNYRGIIQCNDKEDPDRLAYELNL